MSIQAIGSSSRRALVPPAGTLLLPLRVRLAAPRLDARLAAGEDPIADAAVARRSTQLVSRRLRRRIAAGVERLCSEPDQRPAFTAAIPVNRRAVQIARPALEQLAGALRARESVQPRGVALTQLLLTEPSSAVYQPANPDELYRAAREALLALATGQVARRKPEEH
jgi:hypothetical protein